MQTKEDAPQLYELARAIPKRLIEPAPAGRHGTYVPHFVITQVLLATVGPFDWEIKETVYGIPEPVTVGRNTDNERRIEIDHDVIVGCVGKLTVQIDGRPVVIEEIGSCHLPAKESDNGTRLKKASSDALKRCAMRLGVGLHLWCKRADQFFLPEMLRIDEDTRDDNEPAEVGGEEQESDE